MTISTAKIIADSISEQSIRITTLELEMPRFLLAQFNTHRMFSRSAQSSRAVPVQKMIEALNSNGTPVFRQAQKGMQAGEIIDEFSYAGSEAKRLWIEAKNYAVFYAKDLALVGVAKEIANRLIEPFSTVKVVVTATELDNFFALRLHHTAQPEMQELAQAMRDAMDGSRPDILEVGEWHLPYIKDSDEGSRAQLALISAARCARVSYLNHDNSTPDIEKDLKLADQLLEDKHLSPFEHQATPMTHHHFSNFNNIEKINGATHISKGGHLFSGNFYGWIQHRQLVDIS